MGGRTTQPRGRRLRWGYGLVPKGWSNALPRRPRSAWKAAQTLRKHALHRASAFVEGLAALEAALQVVQRTLAAGCWLNKRKKNPRTFQLLLALTEEQLA